MLSTWEEKVEFVRMHYEEQGYRVHSGLQFGAELVLYADRPDLVHSDFCIHVTRDDESIDWREMQTLVRSMPDLHKTLVLANVKGIDVGKPYVEELAITTEHAPFRHRPKTIEVGGQKKKSRTNLQN
uniref:tRNA-intron lyase n=1 Tax=Pseudo-nitzschia australis TaxID=44445 RepID=A0A6U9VYS5_9STRA